MKNLAPQALNGGVFEVVSYGADPTGAADSQPAFQAAATAAVAYVASSGGRATLKVNPGKYKLNSPFKIIGGWVTIDAYGAYIYAGVAGQDLFRDYTSQDSSFTLNGSGLQVQGGIWDMRGHTWAQGVEGSSAFTISNSSSLTFRDLTIRNVRSYHGIDINTCNGVVVDNVRLEGFKNTYEWKTNVVAATTANITLSAPQTIDGVAVIAGNRVLVKNQTAGQDNGIYQVNAGAWTRVTDMDLASECNDAAVFCSGGTTQAGMSFYQSATIVTIGTTVQTWATYWLLQAKLATTANIALTGAQSIDGTAVVTGDRILVKNQSAASQNGVYSANTAGAWTRTTDADAAAELNGKSIYVTNGTASGGGTFKQTATVVTVGTDTVTWGSEFRKNRYFSEGIQIDNGPNAIACKSITVNNCYMGPAVDGSGLGSFGKMAGTHTDSSGQFYTNIRFTNNTSVGSLSNAFQGYSFADSVVANNVILGSEERGIRMFFNSGNSGPRLSITDNVITDTKSHGIEIDGGASQLFQDVSITGNVITSTVMLTPGTGIHVDTCDRVTVSNNSIMLSGSPSSQQGIFLETITDGMISDNRILNCGTIGIQTSASSKLNIVNNLIEGSGDGGIWLTAATSKTLVSDNLIVGACRVQTTSANGCVVISGNNANHNITITNNKFQKGSGVEATTPIAMQGSPTYTGLEIGNNNYGVDWGLSGFLNITGTNANVKLYGADSMAVATISSTASASTTLADITGSSIALNLAGTYRFKAFLVVDGGTGTTTTCRVAPTGPTASPVSYTVSYGGAAAATPSSTQYNYAAWSGGVQYGAAMSTASSTYGVMVDGLAVISTTGTVKLQLARGAGTTNLTVQSGRLILEKIG